jgi:hypothetical protein
MSDEYEEETSPLLADGFGDALIGFGTQFNTEVAIYDYHKCVGILMARYDCTMGEAEEFMEVNVCGAYVGPRTPIFRRLTSYREWFEVNGDAEYMPHP